MKALGTFLRYAVMAPHDVVAILVVLVIRALWGCRLERISGCVVVTLRADSWPMRTWYRSWGGTTFGHAVMLAPMSPQDTADVFAHELVHVEQQEGHAAMGLLYALPLVWTWHPVAALVAWAVSSWVSTVCASLVAIWRGEPGYAGSTNEESAYAQTSGTRKMTIDAVRASIPPRRK